MKICLVLVASLVALACGHNNDGGSYSAKKADKVSFKESLIEKIHNIKDKIHAKISSKKEKIHAKKALKHGGSEFDRGAQPAADCSTVMDEVWEEQCGTKYESSCRMEMQPHCTSIQAKECAPETQTRCSFVFEDKCKTISVPKCTIDWEKRCTSTPDCTTIEAKSCTDVEKDVCVTHMDKTCTMSTVNVCRKVAVRESTPVDDTVERIGLKASIKAKAAAHKAHKAAQKGIITDKLASKGVVKAHGRFKRNDKQETEERFSCPDEPGHTIPKKYLCDGREDCRDGSDEACDGDDGNLNSTVSASDGTPEFFYCRNGEGLKAGKVPQDPNFPNRIPIEKKCDGTEDCKDHSDEIRTTCPINPEHAASLKAQQEVQRDKECVQYIRANKPCISDNATLIEELLAKKNTADLKLAIHWRDLRPESKLFIIEKDASNETNLEEELCKNLVQQGKSCKDNEVVRLYELRAKNESASYDYFFHRQGFDNAQEIKRGIRFRRSLKGDIAGDKTDFKDRLETFKAGFKAAKDQYQEAKAQFKATTKALVHAKFNKGDKGVKASTPTIRVRYEKSCQDEPRKICTKTPRQVCHKENVPLCKSEPRETCVQREKCKSWPKKNCGMVHKETCLPFPTKKCTEVSTPVCKIVPRQECTEKKREICETVPTKDCQKVLVNKPRTVCIPRPTTRTIEDW